MPEMGIFLVRKRNKNKMPRLVFIFSCDDVIDGDDVIVDDVMVDDVMVDDVIGVYTILKTTQIRLMLRNSVEFAKKN